MHIAIPFCLTCLPGPSYSVWVNAAGHQGSLETKDFFQKMVCLQVKETFSMVCNEAIQLCQCWTLLFQTPTMSWEPIRLKNKIKFR